MLPIHPNYSSVSVIVKPFSGTDIEPDPAQAFRTAVATLNGTDAPPSRASDSIEPRVQLRLRCKQWIFEANINIHKPGEIENYKLSNPGLNQPSVEQFFSVANGPYGDPKYEAEPSRAQKLPWEDVCYMARSADQNHRVIPGAALAENLRAYQEVPIENLTEKIAGIIIQDDQFCLNRLGLTNAAKKGIKYALSDRGILNLGGQDYHLRGLFSKDKNRVKNYDAYFGVNPLLHPDSNKMLVEVKELQDVFLPVLAHSSL